jgi:Polyketide cyclase / dehydrase and lipid transport
MLLNAFFKIKNLEIPKTCFMFAAFKTTLLKQIIIFHHYNIPMKSLLRYLLYAVLTFLIIGCFLPGSSMIERKTEIAASADKIYRQVSDGKNWNNWSPWNAMEPTAAYQYSEPSEGLGSWMSWKGKTVGTGKNTVIDTLTNQKIRFKLEFEAQGESFAEFTFKENAGKTQVKWTFESDHGWNPLTRWIHFAFIDKRLGKQYEDGLTKLKAFCEKS